MPKSIFYLIAFISSLSFSQDEDSAEDKLDVGLRFGLSLADVVTDSNTLSPRTSFLAGVHLEYKLLPKWSLQPELLLVRKGESSRSRNPETGDRTEERLLLDYLELPIFIKYKFNTAWSLEVGAYASYLVSAKQEYIAGASFETLNAQDQMESIDAGVAFGATYTTEWNFFLGTRFSSGFVNIANNAIENSDEQYNAQFQLYFGYTF